MKVILLLFFVLLTYQNILPANIIALYCRYKILEAMLEEGRYVDNSWNYIGITYVHVLGLTYLKHICIP